jgi:hypothetical protein
MKWKKKQIPFDYSHTTSPGSPTAYGRFTKFLGVTNKKNNIPIIFSAGIQINSPNAVLYIPRNTHDTFQTVAKSYTF